MTRATIDTFRGEAAIRLAAGDYEAVFLPALGMLGASLTWRGAERLSLHGGLSRYRGGGTTGLPLLHPWANRISSLRYRAARVDVDLTGAPLRVGGDGLPRHGTMSAQRGWEVVSLGRRGSAAVLRAAFDYGAREDLLAAFPFPHVLELEAAVSERGLRVATTLTPTSRRSVPVAFGFHPYFRVPGPRSQWRLRLPAREHLELDGRGIPTGDSVHEQGETLVLGARAFDDLYALGRDRRFVLWGRGRAVEVRFDAGYPFGQLYTPAGGRFLAIEPMTAPTDALVTARAPLVRPGGRFGAAFRVAATSGR